MAILSLHDALPILVTDAAGNTATCSFTVTVTDNEPPAIACPSNIVANVDASLCSAVVTYPAPVASPTRRSSDLTQTGGLASGSAFPVGVTTNVFLVTDAAGNTATCSFTGTVNDSEPPAISCPSNIVANVDASLCSAVVTYSAPVGTDNCAGAVTTQTGGLASGSAFPVGVTTNVFLVTDAAGNTATCSFTVTVTDNEPPVISCQTESVASVDASRCSAVVAYTAPVGTGSCAGAVRP